MAKPDVRDGSAYLAPDYIEGKLYDLTRGQYGWLLSFGLMTLAVGIFPSQLWIKIFAVVFMAAGIAGALTYDEGAGYEIMADYRDSRKMIKEGTDSTDGTIKPGSRPWIGLSLIGISLGIEEARGKRVQETGHVFPTGFIINEELTRIAFVISYGGSLRPSFDWDKRMGAEQQVVDVFAQAFAGIGYELETPSLGHVISARPSDLQETLNILGHETLHTDFVKPQPGSYEEAMSRICDQRIRVMATRGNDPVNTFTVTLDLPASLARQMRDDTPLLEGVEQSSVYSLVVQIIDGLRDCGIEDVRCLNLLELDEWARIVRTIKGAGALHDFLYRRRAAMAKMTLDEAIGVLAEDPPWPKKYIRLAQTYLYMDGSYFRTWRTTAYGGLKRFRPGGMVGLQFPSKSRWNTTTVVGRIVSAATEERKMTRSIVWQIALRDEKKDQGRHISQRELDERSRPGEQQTALYRQQAPVFKYRRFVVAAAPNHRMLRLYSAFTVGIHVRRLITLKPVTMPVRQIRAFMTALYGLDM